MAATLKSIDYNVATTFILNNNNNNNNTVWFGETRMVWISDGEKSEDTRNRFNRITACDRRKDDRTNRRTDRHTSCDGIVRAMRGIAQ